jgi:hypothetical protein
VLTLSGIGERGRRIALSWYTFIVRTRSFHQLSCSLRSNVAMEMIPPIFSRVISVELHWWNGLLLIELSEELVMY